MFCPKCGQQQVSEETRFCSRCGLQLWLLPEMIANGGVLPELLELRGNVKKPFFNKKNGVLLSLFWFLFFVPLLAGFFGGILDIDLLGSLFALIGCVGGFMIMLASLVFLPSSKVKTGQLPAQPAAPYLYGHGQQSALPPQQTQPASSYAPPAGSWRAPETGEVARPGSVTDPTTRLFEREK